MSGVEWGEGVALAFFSALRTCCTCMPWNISSLQLVWSLPVSSSPDRTCISQKGGGIICYCNIFGSSKNIFHFAGLMCLTNLFLQHASYRLCILFHHISPFSICLFFYLLLLCFNIHQAVCWIFKYCFLMSLKVISFRHSTLQKVCLSFFKKMSAKMNIFSCHIYINL